MMHCGIRARTKIRQSFTVPFSRTENMADTSVTLNLLIPTAQRS